MTTPTQAPAEPDVQELRRLCELIPKAANKDFSRSEWQRIARTFAIALKSRLSHPGTAPTREQIIAAIKNGRAAIFDEPCVQDDTPYIADAILAILPDPLAIRNAALEEAVGEIGIFALGAEYPIKVASLIDAIRSLKTPADKERA